MTMSSRDRRGWRILLWLSLGSALISAYFGYRVAGDTPLRGIATGIASSIAIATPIMLFEIKGQRIAIFRRLRRLPLLLYFAARVAIYVVIIIGGLLVARLVAGGQPFEFSDIFDGGFPSPLPWRC